MTDRLKLLTKELPKLPKDRDMTPTRTTSYFSLAEWELIHATYEGGTSLRTIYEHIPPPKSQTFQAFKEAYRKWKRNHLHRDPVVTS